MAKKLFLRMCQALQVAKVVTLTVHWTNAAVYAIMKGTVIGATSIGAAAGTGAVTATRMGVETASMESATATSMGIAMIATIIMTTTIVWDRTTMPNLMILCKGGWWAYRGRNQNRVMILTWDCYTFSMPTRLLCRKARVQVMVVPKDIIWN